MHDYVTIDDKNIITSEHLGELDEEKRREAYNIVIVSRAKFKNNYVRVVNPELFASDPEPVKNEKNYKNLNFTSFFLYCIENKVACYLKGKAVV